MLRKLGKRKDEAIMNSKAMNSKANMWESNNIITYGSVVNSIYIVIKL